MSANNQMTLDQKFNALENNTVFALRELKHQILDAISDAVYDLQPDDHGRYLLDSDRQDRTYQRGISLQIKDWDGLSVADLPILDPYEDSHLLYHEPNLIRTVPEKYRGSIETGKHQEASGSDWSYLDRSISILAIDKAGQALVIDYVTSHDEIDYGAEGYEVHIIPAKQAFAKADVYRAIHANPLSKTEFAVHHDSVVGVVFADPHAIESHKAIPGMSYSGEIIGVSSAGYALQILDNKEMVVHETQHLTTDICQMRGQNVVIDYSHGAVGIVREHAELQQASTLELQRESQLEMGE